MNWYENYVNMQKPWETEKYLKCLQQMSKLMTAYSQTLGVQNNVKSAVNEIGMSDNENRHEMKRHSNVILDICVHVVQAAECLRTERQIKTTCYDSFMKH